jgi:hypothetical protein
MGFKSVRNSLPGSVATSNRMLDGLEEPAHVQDQWSPSPAWSAAEPRQGGPSHPSCRDVRPGRGRNDVLGGRTDRSDQALSAIGRQGEVRPLPWRPTGLGDNTRPVSVIDRTAGT